MTAALPRRDPAVARPLLWLALMTETNRRSQVLLMALYTMLLAVGAAMPLVASYRTPAVAERVAPGELRVGGHPGPAPALRPTSQGHCGAGPDPAPAALPGC